MRFFVKRFRNLDKAWSYYCMLLAHRRVASFQQCDSLFDSSESSLLCFDSSGKQVCELIFYK